MGISLKLAQKFVIILIISAGIISFFLKLQLTTAATPSDGTGLDDEDDDFSSYPIPKNWITRERIRPDHATLDLIPKIFHRTWVNESVPTQWLDSYNLCKSHYGDWQTMFWTDIRAREFISEYYPSFLGVYDSYEYPIQRADAIRYFVLFHYGGVYMDLDVGCHIEEKAFSLEDILKFPAIIPKTKPFGYSNDFMASKQRHPFFKSLVMNLQEWKHWYFFPYLTVFFSTGPMYLNFQYWTWKGTGLESVWVLDPRLYSDGSRRIFTHMEGSTWHDWDARLVKIAYGVYQNTSLLNGAVLILVLGLFYYYVSSAMVVKGVNNDVLILKQDVIDKLV